MRYFAIILLIGFGLQNIPGCVAGKNEKTAKEESTAVESKPGDLQKIYVESAESVTTATAGEEVVMTVSGNLPSPAYKLERVEVEIKGKVVELTPLASFDRSVMAAQMLVPFTESVKVKLPKAGEYVIRVIGRNENRESRITVK